jgi:hypothetical protein
MKHFESRELEFSTEVTQGGEAKAVLVPKLHSMEANRESLVNFSRLLF